MHTQLDISIFPSALGWMVLVGRAGKVAQLTFGYDCKEAAWAALPAVVVERAVCREWNRKLVRRLQAYAEGAPDRFLDVPVAFDAVSRFRVRVYGQCRKIPYGTVLTYGQLARLAGSPRAARAVGGAMAANRVPILVPCHRVVASDGGLGGFSAPGGVSMKTRLLTLEGYLPRSGGPVARSGGG